MLACGVGTELCGIMLAVLDAISLVVRIGHRLGEKSVLILWESEKEQLSPACFQLVYQRPPELLGVQMPPSLPPTRGIDFCGSLRG